MHTRDPLPQRLFDETAPKQQTYERKNVGYAGLSTNDSQGNKRQEKPSNTEQHMMRSVPHTTYIIGTIAVKSSVPVMNNSSLKHWRQSVPNLCTGTQMPVSSHYRRRTHHS